MLDQDATTFADSVRADVAANPASSDAMVTVAGDVAYVTYLRMRDTEDDHAISAVERTLAGVGITYDPGASIRTV